MKLVVIETERLNIIFPDSNSFQLELLRLSPNWFFINFIEKIENKDVLDEMILYLLEYFNDRFISSNNINNWKFRFILFL